MEKEFVPYEESLALKELGFDEPCLAWFSDRSIRIVGVNGCALSSLPVNSNFNGDDEFVTAPLYQQAFRWFREKYEYYCHIFPLQITASDKAGYRYSWEIYSHTPEWITEDRSLLGSLTYEEAELACLIKLIEICSELK
jgi:hypothetical protein